MPVLAWFVRATCGVRPIQNSIKNLPNFDVLLSKLNDFSTNIEKNNETYNIQIVLTVVIFPISSTPAISPIK